MAHDKETKIIINVGAPFELEMEMRAETTPLFHFTHFDGYFDAAWLPSVIELAVKAREMAIRLDNTPRSVKRKGT